MRLWYLLVCSIISLQPAYGVVTSSLSHLVVRINDTERQIKSAETLNLIRGDELTLLYGVLEGTALAPDIINFVGYRGNGPRRWLNDDRNIQIPTADLKRGWSVDKKGRIYKIEARTGRDLHGEVFVKLLNPELQSLKISINGSERELKSGDSLSIERSDAIKVVSLKTNIPNLDRLVRVDFRNQENSIVDTIEVALYYRSFVFAAVYLNVNKYAVKSLK